MKFVEKGYFIKDYHFHIFPVEIRRKCEKKKYILKVNIEIFSDRIYLPVSELF